MVDYTNLIQQKREGKAHSAAEIKALVDGYLSGALADYQMSAWLMAVVLRGMTFEETLALADAEVDSGERLDLSPLGRPVVDKHSTGGVGDKVTLVLAPLVAACGAIFGKMSGRSLGHTGGTVDKLEAIPGFVTGMAPGDFIAQLRDIGVCVVSQGPELVPAEKQLYALRDVTATVESSPLIAASIMSKKIAAGSSAVVMDIKVGRGAFLKNRGQAAAVFHLMKKIGSARGVGVAGIISPMDQPLGRSVGNALEVLEAVEALRGAGPDDLVRVVTRIAAMCLVAADAGRQPEDAEAEAVKRLGDGSALEMFRQWIGAQGGDPAFIDDPGRLPGARHVLPVPAAADGYVGAIDALEVGRSLLPLGAGRMKQGDSIDHAAGLIIHAKCGAAVVAGERLAEIHANDLRLGREAAERVAAAFEIVPDVPATSLELIEL
ncbi:MAG: thymidine phosphorylase [Thermoleophilia bacterium]